MKKILLGLLTISIIAIWGCTQKTRCYEIDDTEVEHLWCPKLDSSIVEWMPNVEKLTPYFTQTWMVLRYLPRRLVDSVSDYANFFHRTVVELPYTAASLRYWRGCFLLAG